MNRTLERTTMIIIALLSHDFCALYSVSQGNTTPTPKPNCG